MNKIKNLIFGTSITLMISATSATGCNLIKDDYKEPIYIEYKTLDKEKNINNDEILESDYTSPTLFSEEINIQDNRKLVALTFDDGPSEYTEELVEVLNNNNIKATFFVIGINCIDYPEALTAISDSGHELAIHGNTHKSFTKLSIKEVNNEILDTINYIESLKLTVSKLVRPPYGNLNSNLKENIEYPFILWSIDTEDWKTKDKEQIKAEILNNIQEGSIILMHDTKAVHNVDIAVLEEILPELTTEYNFVTISELVDHFNIELENGNAYRKIKSEN